jgi:lambda family phage portal protein
MSRATDYLRGVGRALMGSGFNAASTGRRTVHVAGSTRSISSLALSDGPVLTAKARKAVMDDPLAAIGVGAYVGEVIGSGIRPHFLHTEKTIRRELTALWARSVPQASATRRVGLNGKPVSAHDFYGMQALVARSVVEAGEAFCRLRPRLERDGLAVPLQGEMIEPEQLPYWMMGGAGAGPGNQVRGGIEFDAVGQRVAYHFYRHHPGDATIWPNTYEITRVPSASVLHVVDFVRGDQIRGITRLASILISLADLREYTDAARFKKMLGAYLFAWLKTATPDDVNLGPATTDPAAGPAPPATQVVDAQKGQLTILDTQRGEEWGFHEVPDVGVMYEQFMRTEREPIAAVLRVSYEMLTGNMSGVNYSSARIRLMTLRRGWRQEQNMLYVQQFCRPWMEVWLEQAALAGVIDVKDYRRRPEEYQKVAWRPERWEYVNPKDDIEATRMELESCLTSPTAAVAERGEDLEDVYSQCATDEELARELGIQPVYARMAVNTQDQRAAAE